VDRTAWLQERHRQVLRHDPGCWPLVLANLRRALRPGGHVYLTIELGDAEELERVFTPLPPDRSARRYRQEPAPERGGELDHGDRTPVVGVSLY
jgi:hypothetical protein